jgi:hypothetical protein
MAESGYDWEIVRQRPRRVIMPAKRSLFQRWIGSLPVSSNFTTLYGRDAVAVDHIDIDIVLSRAPRATEAEVNALRDAHPWGTIMVNRARWATV